MLGRVVHHIPPLPLKNPVFYRPVSSCSLLVLQYSFFPHKNHQDTESKYYIQHQQTTNYKTFNNPMMSSNSVRSLLLLLLAIVTVAATKPSATNAMFGIRASEYEESAIEQGQQHIELRGGSSHQRRPWGMLQEVKNDLFHMAAQQGEEANHRCSPEEVFHECVINYGSVMLGRF